MRRRSQVRGSDWLLPQTASRGFAEQPDGSTVFRESEALPDKLRNKMEPTVKLNHVDLPVADVSAAHEFFEKHFGFHCIMNRRTPTLY